MTSVPGSRAMNCFRVCSAVVAGSKKGYAAYSGPSSPSIGRKSLATLRDPGRWPTRDGAAFSPTKESSRALDCERNGRNSGPLSWPLSTFTVRLGCTGFVGVPVINLPGIADAGCGDDLCELALCAGGVVLGRLCAGSSAPGS